MKNKPKVPFSNGSMQPNKAAYETRVLDRHNKNVIYSTIKSIIDSAKEEKKKAHILSIHIGWEEFKDFTPIQVMGLLLLRDDALEKLKDFMFPVLAR